MLLGQLCCVLVFQLADVDGHVLQAVLLQWSCFWNMVQISMHPAAQGLLSCGLQAIPCSIAMCFTMCTLPLYDTVYQVIHQSITGGSDVIEKAAQA